jgi:hypothetical protein
MYGEQAGRTFRPGMPEMETYTKDAYLCRFLLIVFRTHNSKVWLWATNNREQQEELKALANDLKEGEYMHSLACFNPSSCEVNFSDTRRRAEEVLDSPRTVGQLLETYIAKVGISNAVTSSGTSSLGYEQIRSTAYPDDLLQGQSNLDSRGIETAQVPLRPAARTNTADTLLEPDSPSTNDSLRTRPSWSSLRKVSSLQSLRRLRSRPSFASSSTTLVGQDEKPRSLRSMLSRHRMDTSKDPEGGTGGFRKGED